MVKQSYERRKIAEMNPDAILWDGLDSAIIGITENGKAVYDIRMMHRIVWGNNKKYITPDEAKEWVEFNILNSYVGVETPIHMWVLPTDESEEEEE